CPATALLRGAPLGPALIRLHAHASSRPFAADVVGGVLAGLAVALDGDGGHWIVGSFLGQAGEAHAEIVLFELHVFASVQQARGLHFVAQTTQRYRRAGPEVYVHEERIPLAREAG